MKNTFADPNVVAPQDRGRKTYPPIVKRRSFPTFFVNVDYGIAARYRAIAECAATGVSGDGNRRKGPAYTGG